MRDNGGVHVKDLEGARGAEIQKQLSFCFEPAELREQPCVSRPALIESIAIMPLGPNKVIAFPTQKRSATEAKLLARVLQRSRFFK